MIEFACPKCGLRFKVDAKLAGRKGRCKKCRNQMQIPALQPAAASVVATGMFRLREPDTDVPSSAAAGRHGPGLSDSMQLAPISADFRKAAVKENVEAQEAEVSSYKLAPLEKTTQAMKDLYAAPPAPNRAQRLYQRQVRNLSGLFSKVNNYSYLISIPFILLFFVAIIIKQSNLVALGAMGVILLNALRLLAVLARLSIVPFRESLLHGILFFIPPLTFYYMYRYWSEMKEATLRMISPVITILIIVLTYHFAPGLSAPDAHAASATEATSEGESGATDKNAADAADTDAANADKTP